MGAPRFPEQRSRRCLRSRPITAGKQPLPHPRLAQRNRLHKSPPVPEAAIPHKQPSLQLSNRVRPAQFRRPRPGVDLCVRPASLHAMAADSIDRLRAGVRDVPNFPKHGIVFKDITPILVDPGALPRVDRRFPDSLPRLADRQDCRDRCPRISLWVGRRLRPRRRVCPHSQKGKLPFKTESASLFSRIRRRGNGDACRQYPGGRENCAH